MQLYFQPGSGVLVFDPQDKSSRWVVSSALPREGRGILFLDEINLAPPPVQSAGYQLILDRRVGDYTPSGRAVTVTADNCKAIDLCTGKTGGWAECPEQGCFAVSDDGSLIAVGFESETHLWFDGQKICALPLPGKAHAIRIRDGRLECLCLASEMSLLDASYKRTWIAAVAEVDVRYESLFAYRLGALPKS